MTSSQIATIANLLSFGVVIIISLLTAYRYQRWFFRFWTLAYCMGFLFILTGVIAELVPRTLGLSLVEVILAGFCSYLFLLTSDALLQKSDYRQSAFLTSGFCVISIGMLFAGQPPSSFKTPVALLMFFSLMRLGMVLLGVGRNPDNPRTTFLATPLILLALTPLAFPFLAPTPYNWVGYAAAALLHITVGTGMVLFLLEQVSSEMRIQQKAITKAKSDFLSCVSHELRTPLSFIVGYAELLALELSPPNESEVNNGAQDHLEQIMKATARLSGIIDDLLDYSQIESNRLSYQFEEIELTALVQNAVDNIRALALQSDVQLELEAPDHPLLMRLDSNRMTQALHNLLGNSIKFSPPDAKVEVRVFEDPDGVRITVTDHGPGIPKEQQGQIFEKFHQIDSGTTRTVGGLGLGLAICKAIIAEHQGAIGVEDAQEGGSCFWIKLPFRAIVSPLNPAVSISKGP